jgi:hypothetical protein
LEKAWVGFRAAKRLENDEDMKLYASIIQRLEKELKIEVNDFPELGLCACNLEEANTEEEKEEDEEEDSKLAIIDPWTNEKIQEAKEEDMTKESYSARFERIFGKRSNRTSASNRHPRHRYFTSSGTTVI